MDREDKVLSYRNSTSNHNTSVSNAAISSLYLIEILHQTTTNQWRRCNTGSCILSKFYIKPQHWQDEAQIDTRCILSKFYIKPQQRQRFLGRARSCILSKFYIKPQHSQCVVVQLLVVSYRNSTSNHNSAFVIESVTPLYLIEILHQTTTALLTLSLVVQLYLIEILHQTTTVQIRNDKGEGCILSKFYIKPQHVLDSYAARYGCILSKFYIKPQLILINICCISVVSYRNSTSNHNPKGTKTIPLGLYLIEILHQTTT